MPEIEPPSWLRTWVATLVSSTTAASLGVSLGAILSLIAPYLGANPWSWFFAGTCIPQGILAFLYTTDWMFERRLDTLKRWCDERKITPERYRLDADRARMAIATTLWHDGKLDRSCTSQVQTETS